MSTVSQNPQTVTHHNPIEVVQLHQSPTQVSTIPVSYEPNPVQVVPLYQATPIDLTNISFNTGPYANVRSPSLLTNPMVPSPYNEIHQAVIDNNVEIIERTVQQESISTIEDILHINYESHPNVPFLVHGFDGDDTNAYQPSHEDGTLFIRKKSDTDYLSDISLLGQHLDSFYNPHLSGEHHFEPEKQPFTLNNEYPLVTQGYVNELIKPYMNVLIQADSKESIMNWIPMVFIGDYQREILEAVNLASDTDTARNEVIRVMVEKMLSLADKTAIGVITPWDISKSRDEQLTTLFGPISEQLPIQVTVGSNVYTHNLSQDFLFGLLNMLHGNPEYLFRVGDHPITLNIIMNSYDVNDDRKRTSYLAQLPQGEFAFSSSEVIQGLVTASEWLNIDPHSYVKDLTGIINGTRTTIKF